MKSLKPDINTSQDLSAAPLSYTTSIKKPCKVEQILFSTSVAITETITITIDSATGANYDVTLRSIGLSSESSYIFRPEGQMNLQVGDELKIQCTNANVTGIIYVTVKISEISH